MVALLANFNYSYKIRNAIFGTWYANAKVNTLFLLIILVIIIALIMLAGFRGGVMKITKEIISNLINRDDKTLEQFYLEYANPLVSYVNRFVKNIDASSELVMDLLVDLPGIVEKYYNSFEEERGFVRWLYILARNRAINYNKKNFREDFVEEIDDYTESTSFVDDLIEFKIEDLEEYLDEEQYKIIYLKFKLDYKIDEIAKTLNLTENQVKKRTHKAYMILKKVLEEVYGV